MKGNTNAGYKGPAPSSSLPEGKGASAPDSQGVAFGLSAISEFDAEMAGKDAELSMASSHEGFAREVKGHRKTSSVSSKGKSFTIEG